jgi:hypothetical protein
MIRLKPDYSATIRAGRAYVRLIEATAILADWEEDERGHAKWQRIRRMVQERLCKLLAVLALVVTAEIMRTSQKVLGTARDVGLNSAYRRFCHGE